MCSKHYRSVLEFFTGLLHWTSGRKNPHKSLPYTQLLLIIFITNVDYIKSTAAYFYNKVWNSWGILNNQACMQCIYHQQHLFYSHRFHLHHIARKLMPCYHNHMLKQESLQCKNMLTEQILPLQLGNPKYSDSHVVQPNPI